MARHKTRCLIWISVLFFFFLKPQKKIKNMHQNKAKFSTQIYELKYSWCLCMDLKVRFSIIGLSRNRDFVRIKIYICLHYFISFFIWLKICFAVSVTFLYPQTLTYTHKANLKYETITKHPQTFGSTRTWKDLRNS